MEVTSRYGVFVAVIFTALVSFAVAGAVDTWDGTSGTVEVTEKPGSDVRAPGEDKRAGSGGTNDTVTTEPEERAAGTGAAREEESISAGDDGGFANVSDKVWINASGTEIVEGKELVFTAESSGNVATEKVNWYFGDGGNGSGLLTTHSFGEPGNYTVRMMASTRDGGLHVDEVNVTVDRHDPYPELKEKYESLPDRYARISTPDYTPEVGEEVKLRIVPLGHRQQVSRVEWSFENTSGTAAGATAVKTFEEPGVQVVRATGKTNRVRGFRDTVVLDIQEP